MNNSQKLKTMGMRSFMEIVKTAGHMELMMVTPELAATWLGQLYRQQRKENGNAKQVYTKSMELGHWKVSNDAITITRDGECINGQHRLKSVLDNNEPIVAWVLLYADPDMYDIIDNNYSRSAAQVLSCPNANDAASIAKALVVIEAGGSFNKALRSTATVPRWMIAERYESDEEYIQKLIRTYKLVRSKLGRGAGVAYGIAIHSFGVIHNDFEVEMAADYINQPDATTLLLQRTIQRKMMEKARIDPEWVCGTTLQYLIAKHSGKQVLQFRNQATYVRKCEEEYRAKTGSGTDDSI